MLHQKNNQPVDSDKKINPTVKKLGLVSFFADVASEMLYPITPIFLTTILGTSMTTLGFIEGTAEATASLMKTFSGIWSDRISKRKPFIIIGYFLGAISKPMIGISNQWWHILAARGLDRTGKGLRSSPRDALIADSVSIQKRGHAFGWHRAMDTFGAAMGPLITLAILSLQKHQNLRLLYIYALIPGLLSVLVALSLKEQKTVITNKKNHFNFSEFSHFSPQLKKYLVAWTIFSLANSSDVFLLLKARQAGAELFEIILLYCIYNLTYSFSSPALGKLSDKMPRKNILIFGLLIYMMTYIGFALANALPVMIILFFIYGLYMGATDGVGKALLIDECPAQFKATALGIHGTLTGLATVSASVSAGYLWDHCGSQYTFFFAAFGALIALLLINQIDTKKV